MKGAAEALDACGVEWEARILSAHRMPEELKAYVVTQVQRGTGVFIAGAGLAAHLPGVIASHTVRPVIGVPIRAAFDGLDALLSIVQMPKGVPVATVGVNNSYNAGLLAVQILASRQTEGQLEDAGELEEKLQRLCRERASALLKEPQNREVFE
jgi:5-(carboxyamino)imidazole ribonucleotide mutase